MITDQKKKLTEKLIINKLLKKLNFKKTSTYNFQNDGSKIKYPSKKELIVSQDTLVENVHFFKNDTPESIALKSIRTNLSDILSMGGKPLSYTMSISINNTIDYYWIKQFTNSLYKEQKKHNFYLLGGDIVNSKTLSITITIFGLVKKGKLILRSGSKNNDDIWVTGEIGNSYIGLQILKNKITIKKKKIKDYFLKHYFFPSPPLVISQKLFKFMNSAIDISDGFIGDLEKLTLNNSKGALIYVKNIPFSKYSKELINNKIIKIENILSGGDDYQLLFTSKKIYRNKISHLSKKFKCKVSLVGEVNNSKKIEFLGLKLNIMKKSYVHRI